MKFLLNLSHCVKRYGHLCQFFQNHSPNMVMSRDLASNSENFLSFALFCIKFYQIWGKLAQEQKVTGKKQIGGGQHPQLLLLESHLDALRCIFGCLLKLNHLEILALLCLVDHRPPHFFHEDQLQELHCYSVHQFDRHSVFLCLRQKVSSVIPSIFL